MAQPKSPRALIGTAANDDSTAVRTDDDGILLTVPQIVDPIADGDVFYIFDRATIGILRTIVLRVGAIPLRMRFNVTAGVGTPVDLTEGTLAGSGGTALTVRNFNRPSSNTIDLVAVLNASSTTGGTVIFSSQASIGVALATSLGSMGEALVDREDYWILNANTNYLISYTPVASLAVTFMATFQAQE